jgi:hypothetical protein
MPTPTSSTSTHDLPNATGLTYPGICLVLVQYFQSNAFLHRAVVNAGQFEFVLQGVRSDVLGLKPSDYAWVFRELQRTVPPDLADLPDGTILDDHGHVVAPTKDDVVQAEAMAAALRHAPIRLFMS